jgi:hypothetical protein
MANHFTATYPRSPLVLNLTAQRSWPEKRVVLRNRELVVREGRAREATAVRDPGHLLEVPETHFGLAFPAGTCFRQPEVRGLPSHEEAVRVGALSHRGAAGISRGVKGPFHPGELEMQRRAGVLDEAREVGRIIGSALPKGVGPFLARQRFAVAGSLDARGRVWASLLTGPAGFIEPVDPQLLRLAARPLPGDPLAENVGARPELGLLVLDARTRQRMRFNGRGIVSPDGLFLLVEQAYGNCPKYVQQRRLGPDRDAHPTAETRVSAALDAGQRSAIEHADTFFIASHDLRGGADASHRGGYPGFVRVTGPDRLAFDDYPGNSMFNTLGNLVANPSAGLLFVDFSSGGVLQLTGGAEVQPDFSVVVQVEEVRETPGACPLRFDLVAYSPSNPPVSRATPRGISSAEPGETGREDE